MPHSWERSNWGACATGPAYRGRGAACPIADARGRCGRDVWGLGAGPQQWRHLNLGGQVAGKSAQALTTGGRPIQSSAWSGIRKTGNPDLAFELHAWITRAATGTEIATNVEGYVFVWFNTDGSQAWTLGVPSTTRAWYGSAITRDSGGTEVAANAFDGSLYLFGNTDGSTSWSSTLVAGPGTVSTDAFTSWPAIVRYPSHGVGQTGGTEIAFVGPSGP
jgi:hypothetical protein